MEERKVFSLAALSIVLVPATVLTFLFLVWLMLSFDSRPPAWLLWPIILVILSIPAMGFCLGVILTETGKARKSRTNTVFLFPASILVLSVIVFVFDESTAGIFDFFLALLLLLVFSGPTAGIMLAVLALKQIRSFGQEAMRRVLAAFGLLENILIFLFLVILPGAAPPKESARRSPCVNNLKQIGLMLNSYADEHEGQYPPIDNIKNNFIFEANSLHPEYLTDVSIVVCPSDPYFEPGKKFGLISTGLHPDYDVGEFHPDCVTDMSYCYLGWVVTSNEEAEAFFEAYDKLSPDGYGKDIVVSQGRGIGGGNLIPGLGKGMEGLLDDSDIDASKIPVIWDKPSNDIAEFSHVPAGVNVLYLDGHVEFIRYPGKFPASETMCRLLDERRREPIPDCE